MSANWPEFSLGELYEYRSGLSKPRSEFGSGSEFLSFKDVFYNFFVPEHLTELVNSTAKEQESFSIRRGDVFLTRTSETMEELGMSCVALKDYESATFNGFCKRLRPKSEAQIHPEYAAYYFRSPHFRRTVTAMSSMSTRASLNNGMLDKLTIILPPLGEQKAIGTVLKALDDKIELNRKMNQALEEMVQAIYKSWFIDFDGVPEEELVNSELGLIPKGWEVRPIATIIQIIGGGTPKRSEAAYWDGDIPWFSVKDAPSDSDVFVHHTERTITEFGLGRSSARLVPEWTTIISARGTVGKLAVTPKPMAFNQSCYGIRSAKGHGNRFVYFLLKSVVERLQQNAHGSVFDTITRDTFKAAIIPIPPTEESQSFEKVVTPLLERIKSNGEQSRILVELRDTLLPKLISGEIRVPDTEAQLELPL